MNKPLAGLAILGMSLFGLANTASAQDVSTLTADLNGSNEVGEAGDPDGAGMATITIDVANDQVCFDVSAENIDAITGGHIHSGGAGSNGDVVVDFGLDGTTTKGCVDSDTATVASIVANPALSYVNVHSEAYPGGAIRGQLSAPVLIDDDAAAAATDDAAPAATTGAATTGEALAFTGAETGVLAVMGAALVMSGGALVIAARRKK